MICGLTHSPIHPIPLPSSAKRCVPPGSFEMHEKIHFSKIEKFQRKDKKHKIFLMGCPTPAQKYSDTFKNLTTLFTQEFVSVLITLSGFHNFPPATLCFLDEISKIECQ